MSEQVVSATTSTRRRPQVAHAVLAAGLLWVVLLPTGALGPLAELTFAILGVGAVVCAFAGVRRNQPVVRWPWTVIGAALAVLVIGGSIRVATHTVGNLTASRPMIPDFVTIPGYVILAIGLFGIAHSRRRGQEEELDVVLDGVLAALGALALAWIFLVNPTLFHEQAPLWVRLALSCYPPLSVFLVAVAAGVAFSQGRRRPFSYVLLLAAMISMLVGDIAYMLLETKVIPDPGHLMDVPYALAFVAFMAAVLDPSMRELTEPVPTDERAPRGGRLALVAVALAIPGLVTVIHGDAGTGDRIVLGLTVLTLTALAILRMFRALRAHARSEARLAHQATHDVLTGLPNRQYVLEHLSRSLEHLKHDGGVVAVLFLDIDRFKLVNDGHGHSLGDELLLAVARRLTMITRTEDIVARIGGDEFVLVVQGLRSADQALDVAERTRLAFSMPFVVRGGEIASTVSIGVAIADGTDDAVDAESMIRDADAAMYQAKEAGRDATTVFDRSMRDRAAQRLELEGDLRHALARDELHLHYQPLVRLPAGRVEGVEALLRWSHPRRGQVAPTTFIPVAEDTGLIVPIGAWVLNEACRQLAEWRSRVPGMEDLHISVNLSARQLRDDSLVDTVKRTLATYRLPASALHLELTESHLMENPAGAAELLERLRDVGVRLAIDDFGTGYSSLSYLQRFAVDAVKIDRSFVMRLEDEDTSDESLVAAIVAMAGALQVTTVAEGVETEAQAQRLHALGCHVAQGYLYSRPVAGAQLPEVFERLGGRITRLRPVPASESA